MYLMMTILVLLFSCNMPVNFTLPIHNYERDTTSSGSPCSAITAGAFVPTNSNWAPTGSALNNKWLFGDYVCGKIWYLDVDTKYVHQHNSSPFLEFSLHSPCT
jgi:hypothetical protein